jgi:hypothetical protein
LHAPSHRDLAEDHAGSRIHFVDVASQPNLRTDDLDDIR